MKFSSFSSVLNFHCMSTQMVPRANNDPYLTIVLHESSTRKAIFWSVTVKKSYPVKAI